MDDTNKDTDNAPSIFATDAPAPAVSELDLLKTRAEQLGIEFSNNIGLETLKARVNAKLGEKVEPAEPMAVPAPVAAPADAPAEHANHPAYAGVTASPPAPEINPFAEAAAPVVAAPAAPKSLRQQIQEEQLALVRIRITNMDPKKADLPGEIYTVANEYLGTVRKYVPFGEATDEGYHVPVCIYNMLVDKKFLNIRTRKGPNGVPKTEQTWAREFAIEVLPPLTQVELAQLATAQAAAGSLNT